MATEIERLSLLLEVQGQKFENQLKRQNSQAYRIFKQLEDRASAMEKGVGASLGSLGKKITGVFAGIAVGSALNDIRKAGDEYIKIMNSLKTAGVSSGALGGTFNQLFEIAQKNAAPLDTLAQLYGRVSQAQTTLKATSGEIMQVTDIVAQSLRVSGVSASEASGALLQLAQAFSNGKVQAEEYNSLLDGAYPLLQAAAAGLQEAGGDVAKLTALVKDGQVSSEAFFRAIQAGAPLLEQKLAGASLTTEQAMTRLNNEFVRAVGEFDKATGASQGLAAAINTLADNIGGVGRAAAGAVNGVQSLIAKVGELARANAGAQRQQALSYQDEKAARIAQAREMGLANAGGRETLAAERAAANEAATAANKKALSDFRQSEVDFANQFRNAPLPPTRPGGAGNGIKPVSLKDFKVPGDDKGGGGSSKEALDSYERELIQIEKRTKALQLEAEMTGKSTFEKSKAKAVLDLETAAKKANITVTDEMRASIEKAATGYANAKVKVEEVQKALESFQDAQKFLGDAATDALEDLIINGEKAEDVVKNLAKSLAKAALQAALMGSGPLAGIFGTAGTGGNAGGLVGLLTGFFKGFDDGGFTGAGGKNTPKGVVHGGEYVFSKKAVQKLGLRNLESLHRGFASGGYVGAPTVPSGIAGSSQPRIIVNNTQSQQVEATPKQESNGDITVLISAVQAKIADDMLRGRGPVAAANNALRTNRHLR